MIYKQPILKLTYIILLVVDDGVRDHEPKVSNVRTGAV